MIGDDSFRRHRARRCAAARRLRVRQAGAAPLRRTGVFEGSSPPRVVPVVDLDIAAGVGRELWDERADAWVALPNDAPSGEYVALRIVGDSMAPLMHTGDTVLVKRGADVIQSRRLGLQVTRW